MSCLTKTLGYVRFPTLKDIAVQEPTGRTGDLRNWHETIMPVPSSRPPGGDERTYRSCGPTTEFDPQQTIFSKLKVWKHDGLTLLHRDMFAFDAQSNIEIAADDEGSNGTKM
jgi:hypothetical protein